MEVSPTPAQLTALLKIGYSYERIQWWTRRMCIRRIAEGRALQAARADEQRNQRAEQAKAQKAESERNWQRLKALEAKLMFDLEDSQ